MRAILRVPPSPSAFSTAFPGTENPLSQSGAWRTAVNFYKQPQTTPGKCFGNGTTDDFDDALAQLLSPSFGAGDYEITATIFRQGGYSPGVSHEVGLYLDLFVDNSNPSNTLVSGFEMLFPYDSSSFQIFQWLGVNHSYPDNFNQLSPSAQNGGLDNVLHGDVLKAKLQGTNITITQNGSVKYTLGGITRSGSGGPGMGFYVNTGATAANYCISNYAVQRL